jgi:hypothetical protein
MVSTCFIVLVAVYYLLYLELNSCAIICLYNSELRSCVMNFVCCNQLLSTSMSKYMLHVSERSDATVLTDVMTK